MSDGRARRVKRDEIIETLEMNGRRLPREVLAVWALAILSAAAVFATYSRTPLRDLYHVSASGPAAGAGRALVFSNFPVALMALGILGTIAAVSGRRIRAVAGLAAVLCAAVAWPGVVDQADLDAKWPNAVAAVGVLLALVLTALAVRGGPAPARRVRGDGLRLAFGGFIVAISLPWVLGDLGISIGDVPFVGRLFVSEQSWAPFGHARLHAGVHVGHHHGEDGLLLALTALLLARALGTLPPGRLRMVQGAFVSLMLVYGLAQIANDFWYEQLVKRDLLHWAFPLVLTPAATLPWLLLLLSAAVAWPFVGRRTASSVPVVARWQRPALAALATAAAGLIVVGATHDGTAAARVTPFALQDPRAVVFSMAVPHSRLYAARLDGTLLRRLTDDDGSDLAPDVAPDGRIVYQSNPHGNWELYVLGRQGPPRQLTHDSADEGEPAWSPDGRRVAFIRDGDLYVMAADGSDPRKLADNAEWPTWSPDGRRLAFSSKRDGNYDVFAIAAAGSEPVRMTHDSHDDRRPAWSPDGSRLAFESDRDGWWHLYVLRVTTGTVVALTRGASNDFAPAWSPDGRRLVFLSDRDGNDQLFVMQADGNGVRRLTSGQADKDTPSWLR